MTFFALVLNRPMVLIASRSAVLAELDHLLRSLDVLEQRACGDVDAGVGRLRRQHDGDEQLVGIVGFELGRRRGVRLRQPAEEFEDLVALHSEPITSRIE